MRPFQSLCIIPVSRYCLLWLIHQLRLSYSTDYSKVYNRAHPFSCLIARPSSTPPYLFKLPSSFLMITPPETFLPRYMLPLVSGLLRPLWRNFQPGLLETFHTRHPLRRPKFSSIRCCHLSDENTYHCCFLCCSSPQKLTPTNWLS